MSVKKSAIFRRSLTEHTNSLLVALSDEECERVVDMATSVMVEMGMRRGGFRTGLGENGAVELVIKTILFFSERGTTHE
jgi:hypothetical protein